MGEKTIRQEAYTRKEDVLAKGLNSALTPEEARVVDLITATETAITPKQNRIG